MKKGYIVGEYIIVVFFFLILFVGIVDQVILVTSEEISLTQNHESCETAERIFKELIDNEDDVSKYGVSAGNATVNYNATKYLYDNKNLGDYNNDTNKMDSFQLAYEIKGFDVQSAYASKFTDFTTTSPKAQLWSKAIDSGSSDKVKQILGVAAGGNTNATFKLIMILPNATTGIIAGGSFDIGDVTLDATDYGVHTEIIFDVESGNEKFVYISYTTNNNSYTDWDEHWTRYGSNFQAINNIQRDNNLVFIRDISFRNEALAKDYPIYLGNDTLAKLKWGAPVAEGCEYKRLYKIESNESFLANQTIWSEKREINITRNFIGEVKIISA